MLKNISDFLDELKLSGETFCDLFSGSASVGDYFKDKYQIISNDTLFSSFCFAYAKTKNATAPSFDNFRKQFNTDVFAYFNSREYDFSDKHFLWMNYSPKGGRLFFTEAIANKIDGIRLEIEQLYQDGIFDKNEYYFMIASLLETVMGYSNTSGTYEAFLKEWDSRALKPFVLEPLGIERKPLCSNQNTVFCRDSNELIKILSGDILYLDTPYTITDYFSAYHLLETIAKYDYPAIRGKTGRRVEKGQKSKYSIKGQVYAAYEDLIKNADFKHIIISYSTQSLMSIDELLEMLKKYAVGEVVVKYFPFREYKNIRVSQKGENLREVLIYMSKKKGEQKPQEIIKSPLNYSGSKNYIVDQILGELPARMSVFVDAMGGAFNVGVNVANADTVVYNEYNKFVYEIIDMLLSTDKEKLKEDIRELIARFGLEKSNKEAYLRFRDFYNKNKTPLNLFVLQMYCFQNQLRFNSDHDFNTPVGNCGCNETTFERIDAFVPRAHVVKTTNMDFADIDLSAYPQDTVFYFDPPYIITNATYNDGKRGFKGWTKREELELLSFLDKIHRNGQKFLLSNVITHNGKTNEQLQNWVTSNNYKVVKLIPHNGRYGAREEVLIKNY